MRANYRAAMEWLYIACIAIAGVAMLIMTIIIPYGLFMIRWGVLLVQATWQNTIAEFPQLSVGVTYLPIPVAGAITLLFVIERLWLGEPPQTSYTFRDAPQAE